ncbi:glycohydrolase toxin TNT-related protein (plasmid) [Tritonibacter scottomollicae]|uniref:Glycohydrolase toxin TNT-related protein n=1 Tax=Tritonibacter scottomollicae TaxID=483013 RepID=A0ABZ0HPF7_TRISK|nr:glycohydrolase toxin TNT-related protein [Tritonibacter scottomollicae]WOI35372.1 glycohydrolase toxin TNT-related protein [Tritonibacter scottomollicae]
MADQDTTKVLSVTKIPARDERDFFFFWMMFMHTVSQFGLRKSFVRKLLGKTGHSFTFLMCLNLAFQPLMVELAYAQEIIIDPSGNVGFSPNVQQNSRAPVVDIATPNSGGVSHNQYERFDVTSRGVILNNSQSSVQTQVAGTISGNPNLADGTAVTIVNEVTSTRTSALNGSIEVGGDRAGVIIANPNGITCNGCNFINASNGTLTTGVPVINGSNVRLDVTQGTVTVGRRGLPAANSNVSNINLIGRTVVIDGKVTAIEGINVQGGAQSYDLTNQRRVSPLTGTGATPDFVVDGREYGAMEAGRIQIIGNELGLGVRTLGAIQSTANDVRIIGEGDTTVRSVAGQGQVRVQSNDGNLTLERDITSATSNVIAYARHDVNTTDRTGIYGFTGVQVTARKGTLSFGGDLQSGADVDLFGERQLTFSGYGSATGEFKLRGRSAITVEDATIVANSVDANDGVNTFRLSDAAIFSTEAFRIKTGEFQLGKDVLVDGLTEDATSNLIVEASGHFRNSADLRRHKAAMINYAGNLYNEVGGIIEEVDLKIASTSEIHNAGVLYGSDSIDLNVAQLFNNETGAILSKSITIKATGLLENNGTITSDGNLTLTSGRKVTNDGYIQAVRAYLTAPEVKNAGNGELRVRDYGQITASSSFANDGILASLASFKVSTGRFENKGVVSVDSSIEVVADTIINQKSLTAGERITLRSTGDIKNLGILASYDQAHLAAESRVENQGSILVDGMTHITGNWFDNKGDDAVLRTKTGRISSENIRNSGQIYLVDTFQHQKLNTFENNGILASQGVIQLEGQEANLGTGSVILAGLKAGDEQDLIAGQSISILFDALSFGGQIAAGGNISLTTGSDLRVEGRLQAGRNLSLNARNTTIEETAELVAGGDGNFRGSGAFINNGIISLTGTISIGGALVGVTNNNFIATAATNKVEIIHGSFVNNGVFQAVTGGVSIEAAGVINNGFIQSAGHLNITSQIYENKQNKWVATRKADVSGTGSYSLLGDAKFSARQITLGDGGFFTAEHLNVRADSFHAHGSMTLSGHGRNEWKISDDFRQYGSTYSSGNIQIESGTFSTSSGSFLGVAKSLSARYVTSATLNGALSAETLGFSATRISGADTGSIIVSGDASLRAQKSLNYFGEIAAGRDLTLSAPDFDLRGNVFGNQVFISATNRGYTRGSVFATETLNIDIDGALHNYGLLEARDKVTTRSGGVVNYADAKISSTEIELQTSGGVSNSGEISAASRVTIKSRGSFNNASEANLTAVSLGLTANGFRNQGSIDVYGFFGDVNGRAENYGTINSETYFGLEADEFSNRNNASILSQGHLYIKTTNGELANYAGAQISGEVVDLRVRSLSNSGLIQAQEVVNVANVARNIRNNTDGEIHAKTIALLANGSFRNNGVIGRKSGTDLLNISGRSAAENFGQIAASELRFISQGKIENHGSLEAQDFLGLQSSGSSVSNYGTLRGSAILAEAGSDFLNEGLVQSNQEIFVDVGGSIINRDGDTTTAEIKAPTINLVASQNIDNNATLLGENRLALISDDGRIYNNGNISGSEITLVARQGGVYSPASITAADSLAIEARTIDLKERIRVVNSVILNSTHYDITVEGRIETKELFVDAARDVKAAANVFRGSDRTQIIANDIQRTDTSEGNRKLGSISGAGGDIYVRLRSGSLGTWASNDGTGNSYESVNWDVVRSVSLIADQGNILLSGRIQADDDLFVQAKEGNTGIKDIRFDIGDVLHLEGRGYLKKNGWWNPASARKVQLVQNYGWLYTDNWLSDVNIDFDLTVQAKSVVVNSSHRFVGKNLFLRASDKITQRDQVISARQLTYSAGNDIFIKFDPFAWRENNPGIQAQSSYWDMANAGLRGATLLSQGAGMTLYAGRDITFKSGKIHSGGNLSIAAGRNIVSEPIYRENRRGWQDGKNNVPANVGWNFSTKYRDAGNWRPGTSDNVEVIREGDLHLAEEVRHGLLYNIEELRAYTNQISARDDIEVIAGGHTAFVGTSIASSHGDITVSAELGISIAAAWGYREFSDDWSWSSGGWFKKRRHYRAVYQYDDIYTRPVLTATRGDVTLRSEGDVLAAGAQITTGGDLTIASAQRNVLLGTYKERYVRNGVFNTSKRFLGIKYSSSKTSINIDADINTASDFRADSQLTLTAENDIHIIGGRYQARRVVLDAGRNLHIDGAINSIRLEKFTERGNFITITTIQEGFDRESVSLPEILSTEEPEFNTGGDVHIAGWRGQNLNASLLRTIEQRDFDNALVNLYTPEDQAGAQEAAREIDQKYLRDFDLPGASDGQQFAYLDTLIQDYGATYHTIQLRDHQWYDKQVRLNPAFQALLQAVATYITAGAGAGLGIQNAFLRAGVDSALASTVSGIAGGAITGDIDLDEILRGAVLAGASTTISGFLTDKINLGSGLSDTSPFFNDERGHFAVSAIVDRAGDAVINRVVTNVVYGEDPFANFDDLGRTFLVTETLAVAQFGIGELGHGNANWEGSVGHLLLHGGVGCVALEALDGDCAAGFFAGASSSLLAGSNLSDEQKLRLAPLVGAFGGFIGGGIDGGAINVSFGGTISESGVRFNYLTHAEASRKRELLELLDSEECRNGNCEELRLELVALNRLDQQRDDDLRAACSGIGRSQAACYIEVEKAYQAFKTYDAARESGLLMADGTFSEFVQVSSLWAENRQIAMSYEAANVLAEMPLDAVRDTLDLLAITGRAAVGDTEAQALLRQMGADILTLIQDPVNTVEQRIAAQLERADTLEAQGNQAEADRIRSEIILSGVFNIATVGGGAGITVARVVGRTVPEAPDRPRVTQPSPQQIATANDLGIDPRWINADGSIDWPPNDGFDGPQTITELQPGARFDRYGGRFDENGQFVDTGGYVSPTGVPFEQRSLPNSSVNRPYQEYEVLQPIPNVSSGSAAPWFGQPGGGTQYQLPMSIESLVEQGFIRPVFD